MLQPKTATPQRLCSQKQSRKRLQSPDADTSLSIFDRSKEWLNNKSSKLSEQRVAQQNREVEACSFKPQLNKRSPKAALNSQSKTKKSVQEKLPTTYSQREATRRKIPLKNSEAYGKTQTSLKDIHQAKKQELALRFTPTQLEQSLKDFETPELTFVGNQSSVEPWTSIYQDLEKQKKLINFILDSEKKVASQS